MVRQRPRERLGHGPERGRKPDTHVKVCSRRGVVSPAWRTMSSLRGGTVIDGTGAPGRTADVGDHRRRVIAEIGDGLDGRRELDAVGPGRHAPGFIDIHTHYDAQVFWDPALTPSSWHGVTTVVAGNCGFSIAPCRPEHRDAARPHAAARRGHEPRHARRGRPVGRLRDVPRVPRRGRAPRHVLNYGVLRRPHRGAALRDGRRRATSASSRPTTSSPRCRRSSREALEAGAVGFASSSSPTHNGDGGRPVPSRARRPRRARGAARAAGELGRGVAALLPGERIKHADVYDLQRRSAARSRGPRCSRSRASRGTRTSSATTTRPAPTACDVWPQVSCRPLVFQMNLREPFTFNMRAGVRGADGRARRGAASRRYRDPAWRARRRTTSNDKACLRPELGLARGRRERRRTPSSSTGRVADIAAERGLHRRST